MVYVKRIGENIFRVLLGVSIFYFTVIGFVYYMYGEEMTMKLMFVVKNFIMKIFN